MLKKNLKAILFHKNALLLDCQIKGLHLNCENSLICGTKVRQNSDFSEKTFGKPHHYFYTSDELHGFNYIKTKASILLKQIN